MLKILKTEDREVLGKANFSKNAIFYKDLQAFYEAYDEITENESALPSFCFDENKHLCIEGLCLLMKMYASEFKFETMKLTLDYLKILYFAMASYSDDEGMVDTLAIHNEFHEYRRVGEKFCEEQKEGLKEKQNHAKEVEKTIKKQTERSLNLSKRAKVYGVLAIIFFVFSTLCVFVPVLAFMKYSLKSVQFWCSVFGVLLGFIVTIVLKVKSKTIPNLVSDLSYHISNMRKNYNSECEELNQHQSRFYRIACEKGEYNICFSELISRFGKTLTIKNILDNSRNYKLLSYNIAYDIGRLFKSQQKEIDEIVNDIESVSTSMDYKREFVDIYLKIKQQDWLYYNAEIRYHYLNKFIEFAEKDFEWELDINNEKVNPFDVNVRNMAHEKIAYMDSKNKNPIIMDLSDFMKTKFFKNIEDFRFADGYSVDALKRVKSNYLSRFYNTEFVQEFRKSKEIEVFQKMPTLVNLKLKLIEDNNGLGNSDAKVIKDISSVIFKDEKKLEQEDFVLKESDIDYPKFTAQKIEESDDVVVYYVGNEKKVGYKIN